MAKKILKRKEIREIFEELAKSQGFYGRTLYLLDNEMDSESVEQFWQDLESQEFTDSTDVILYMEC